MGGWLRASPGRSTGSKNGVKGVKNNNVSASSFMSSQSDGNNKEQNSHARARDAPVKHNLNAEFDHPGDARTGGQNRREKGIVISASKEKLRGGWPEERYLRHDRSVPADATGHARVCLRSRICCAWP